MSMTVFHKEYSRNDRDKDLSLFIAAYFLMNSINTVFSNVIGFSGTRLTIVKLVLGACLLILLIKPMIHFSKNEWAFVVFSECVVCILYFYSYLLGASWVNLSSWIGDTISVCVPMMFCVRFIYDKEILLSILLKVSWAIFFLQSVIMTRNITGRIYDIHFSYTMCLLVLIHFNEAVDHKRLIAWAVLVVEMIMLTMFGSRGALVCIACFVLIKIMINTQSRNRKILYSIILLIVFIGLIEVINHGDQVYLYLSNKGISSRTLRLLLSGQFVTHDSERNLVWESSWEGIRKHPIMGWGINGALDVLRGHAYPHQLFLELWLSFGLILGSILIFLVILPVRSIFLTDKGAYAALLQMFFCIGFISLMFSGTIFTSYYYFIFLGLSLHREKKQTETSHEA